MIPKVTQNKHRLKNLIEIGLLHDLEEIGEIRLSSDGRVYGMNAFLKRYINRRKVRR